MGGVLVDSADNLHYIENTYSWAGRHAAGDQYQRARRTNSSIDATGGTLASA